MPRYSLQMSPLGGISLSWPNKCVVCGQDATTHGEASCNVLTHAAYRLIWWEYSTESMSVRYPFCRKHRLLRYLPSLVSRRNLLNLSVAAAVLWLFIYESAMPLWANLTRVESLPDPNSALIASGLLIAGIAAFLLAKHFTPVKLNDIANGELVISISNPQYAREFEVGNADRIRTKNGYLVRAA
jgi:hypothetical protein